MHQIFSPSLEIIFTLNHQSPNIFPGHSGILCLDQSSFDYWLLIVLDRREAPYLEWYWGGSLAQTERLRHGERGFSLQVVAGMWTVEAATLGNEYYIISLLSALSIIYTNLCTFVIIYPCEGIEITFFMIWEIIDKRSAQQ